MGTIHAVCTSNRKGIQKSPQACVELKEDWGIVNDAHAGKWHRQVSLLGFEAVEEFKDRGANVDDGSFGENLIVEGFDLKSLPLGTRLTTSRGVELELTQIGKECHTHCAIYYSMGECIMPREGVFTRVVKGGPVHPGDAVEITRTPTPEETQQVMAYVAACVAAQKGAPFVG